MARKPKSLMIEESGIAVRVYQNGKRWWADVRIDSKRSRTSLKTVERGTAETNARALARELAKQKLLGVKPDTLTLGQLFIAYNENAKPLLNEARQKWVASRQAMFLAAWREDLEVRRLSQRDVEHFCAERRAGRLTPFRPIQGKRKGWTGRNPVAVRQGTLAGDFRWLSAAFNFAVEHEVDDVSILTKNPLHRLALPKEKNPRRPVASHLRFTRTLEQTDATDSKGRLRCLLQLARYTGRRIDAMCNLRVSDVLTTPDRLRAVLASTGRDERLADDWPLGAVRWRAEHNKQGFDELAPLSVAARDALDTYMQKAGRVGDAVLFPAPEDDDAAIERRLVTRWLLKAERLAGLPKLEQGAWHAYRRLWAVERKDLPDVDVASAGGWRDTRALKMSYQQTDPATMLRVVSHRA